LLLYLVIGVIAVCLVSGVVMDSTDLVWIACGASLVAIAAFGTVWRRRPASSPVIDAASGPPAEPASVAGQPSDESVSDADQGTTGDEPAVAAEADTPGQAPDVTQQGPPVLLVQVLPGRRRFHLEECRLLAGRPGEVISLQEALDEGFTACTACVPNRDEIISPR